MTDSPASAWHDLQAIPPSTPPDHRGRYPDGYDWSAIYTVDQSTPDHSATGGDPSAAPTGLLRQGDRLRIRDVELSPRASAILLARARNASAGHVGELLSLLLEHGAHVVESHGPEVEFDDQEAMLIARSFSGVIREPGGVGDVGSLATNVWMQLQIEHEEDAPGEVIGDSEWPVWQHALLARLRAMKPSEEAAVFDRLLLAVHPSMQHLRYAARLRAAGLARSSTPA